MSAIDEAVIALREAKEKSTIIHQGYMEAAQAHEEAGNWRQFLYTAGRHAREDVEAAQHHLEREIAREAYRLEGETS